VNYIPQIGSLRRPVTMWLIAASGTIIFMGLIIGAPVLLASGHAFWGLTIFRAFSFVCHQIPERSFFIAGHPFAVCSRCTGIYSGFTIAMLSYPLVRSLRQTESPPRKWLFIAAAPLAIDFALGFFDIWANTHSSRFASGALLGAVSVFYVMPGLMELSLRRSLPDSRLPAAASSSVRASITPSAALSAPSDYSAPHRRI
jgi:uncharacterized membrane protein